MTMKSVYFEFEFTIPVDVNPEDSTEAVANVIINVINKLQAVHQVEWFASSLISEEVYVPRTRGSYLGNKKIHKSYVGTTPIEGTTPIPLPPEEGGGGEFEGFPDATNTGVPIGTTLTPSGGIATSSHGQIIEELEITGSIQINHNNVIVRKCLIHSSGQAISVNPSTSGASIEDCELDGSTTALEDGSSAIGDSQYSLLRCNIHDYPEGPRANGENLIEDNYMHDFLNRIAIGAHQDGIQSIGGSNITIRHNTILMNVDGANAAVACGAGQTNVLVENNLLAGGGYCTYGGDGDPVRPGQIDSVNMVFNNNAFSKIYYPGFPVEIYPGQGPGGYFGYFTMGESSTFTNNYVYETDEPLS